MDVKRYYWNQTTIGDGPFDGPGWMSSSSGDPSYDRQVVDASDFDRLTAELAALQSRLNETDAENDRLRSAGKEMLRVSGLSVQGSNAYNRAVINLHQALENKHEQQ